MALKYHGATVANATSIRCIIRTFLWGSIMLAILALFLLSPDGSAHYREVFGIPQDNVTTTPSTDLALDSIYNRFDVAKRTPAEFSFADLNRPPSTYVGDVPWTNPEVSATNEVFGKASAMGESLRRWMRDPSGAGGKAISPWKHFSSLAEWGWVEHTMGMWADCGTGIDHLVKPVNHRVDKQYQVKHVKDHPSEGDINYPATGGFYTTHLFPDKGVIVAENNWSPEKFILDHMTPKHYSWDPVKDKGPKLGRWSDIVWLGWKKYTTPEQRKGLRTIVRHQIVNDETRRILAKALRGEFSGEMWAEHGIPPPWPKTSVFTKESYGWRALIGTPNVWGVAYLCIQRRKELGVRLEIAKITAFHDHTVGPQPTLIIELSEVPEGEGAPLSDHDSTSEEEQPPQSEDSSEDESSLEVELSSEEEKPSGSQPPGQGRPASEHESSSERESVDQQEPSSEDDSSVESQPQSENESLSEDEPPLGQQQQQQQQQQQPQQQTQQQTQQTTQSGQGKGKGKWKERLKRPFKKLGKGKGKQTGEGSGTRD